MPAPTDCASFWAAQRFSAAIASPRNGALARGETQPPSSFYRRNRSKPDDFPESLASRMFRIVTLFEFTGRNDLRHTSDDISGRKPLELVEKNCEYSTLQLAYTSFG
jgi:hypothetical protein